MRYAIIALLLLTGCTQTIPVPDSAQLSEIKKALSGVGAIAKQNDSTHSQLRDQSEKLERIIEKLATKPDDNPPQIPVVVVDGRPKLWVTYADFNCPPCDQLKADIAAGKLDEFQVIVDSAGTGLKTARPAIRFAWPDSATGYGARYEWGPSTLVWLKTNLLEPKTATVTVSQPRYVKPVASHNDLVAMHNRLHGGGQWTWPGDLATHLRTTHGVNLNGTSANHPASSSTSQRANMGAIPRGPTQYRRTRNTSGRSRTSCPTCPR